MKTLIRSLFLVAVVPMLGAAMCGAPPPVEEDPAIAEADLLDKEMVLMPDGRLVAAKDLPTLADYLKTAQIIRK